MIGQFFKHKDSYIHIDKQWDKFSVIIITNEQETYVPQKQFI